MIDTHRGKRLRIKLRLLMVRTRELRMKVATLRTQLSNVRVERKFNPRAPGLRRLQDQVAGTLRESNALLRAMARKENATAQALQREIYRARVVPVVAPPDVAPLLDSLAAKRVARKQRQLENNLARRRALSQAAKSEA